MERSVYLAAKFETAAGALLESDVAELKQIIIKYKAPDLLCRVSGAEDQDKRCIEYLFEPLLSTLQAYEGLGNGRLVCCDALSIWLLRSVQILTLKTVSENDAFIERLLRLLTDLRANFLFDYIVDFWNESGSPLSNSLKDLLSKMVLFLSAFRSKRENNKLFESWCVKVLNTIPHSKRVLYFSLQTLSKHIDPVVILQASPSFIEDSMAQMYSSAFSNSVAKCISAILEGIYHSMSQDDQNADSFETEWLNIWKVPVINSLKSFILCRNVQVYLLPLLFKIPQQPRNVYKQVLALLLDLQEGNKLDVNSYTSEEDIFKLSLYLGCLKIGQDLQIVEEPFSGDDFIIELDVLKDLLTHKSKNIRLTSYAILTGAAKRSLPVPSFIYPIILDIKDIYFVDDDPDARNEFHSLTRNFILRVRDSTYALSKKLSGLEKKGLDLNNSAMAAKIEAAHEFLTELINYIKSQIAPGMTYQRVNLGFKLLISLITSGIDKNVDTKYHDKKHIDYPFQIDLYTKDLVRLLVDNIANNFDDIREFSVQVLLMAPSLEWLSSKETINNMFLKSVSILKNIQGKQSDSGARLLQFVFKYNSAQGRHDENKKTIDFLIECLDENVKAAIVNLTDAVSGHSVHGLYKGLSVIIDNEPFAKLDAQSVIEWKQRIVKIMKIIVDNWNVTKEILSNESPEGNVPDKFKENDKTTEYGPASQIISNYAWRSVKDSSLVLKNLLVKAPSSILTRETILQISELILEQLGSVNHKGAFYSIYPTFEECCHRCYRKDSGLENEPAKWLDQNLSLIKVKSTYIIRRSAGLPFLISIILMAENRKLSRDRSIRKSDRPLFISTWNRLMEIARKPIKEEDYKLNENIELPQVHAFNCIKQLFVEANLSEISAFYVGAGLDLSFWAMQSKIWGIRNCAVMLFASLENKLFGSKKVNDHIVPYSARLFFSRFKGIKQILMRNFEMFLNNKDSSIESVFPILTVLSRLKPTTNFHNDLLEFKPFLSQSLGIKQFKIREMAAKAIPASIFEHETFIEAQILLDMLENPQVSQNKVHGILLAVRELLQASKRVTIDNNDSRQKVFVTISGLSRLLLSNNQMVSKLYVDILNIMLEIGGPTILNSTIAYQIGSFFISQNEIKKFYLDGSKQLLLEAVTVFLLNYYSKIQDPVALGDFAQLAMNSESYRVKLVATRFFIEKPNLLCQLTKMKLVDSLWDLLAQEDVWSYIKSASLELLQNLSTSLSDDNTDISLAHKKLLILFQFCKEDQSEDVRATALQAVGPFIGKLILLNDHNTSLISQWMDLVTKYSTDDNVFDLRYATCTSLLSMLCVTLNNTEPSLIVAKALFLLYLQLTDDSEEIRNQVSQFFCKHYNHVVSVPIYTSNVFVSKYLDEFKAIAVTVLVDHFITRPSLQQVLQRYLELGKVLFDAEKDNLYRVDFELHSLINGMIGHGSYYLTASQKIQIKERVKEDCLFLSSFIEKQGIDGVLGWCSNEIIFSSVKCLILDLRLLYHLKLDDIDFHKKKEEIQKLLADYDVHDLLQENMLFKQQLL